MRASGTLTGTCRPECRPESAAGATHSGGTLCSTPNSGASLREASQPATQGLGPLFAGQVVTFFNAKSFFLFGRKLNVKHYLLNASCRRLVERLHPCQSLRQRSKRAAGVSWHSLPRSLTRSLAPSLAHSLTHSIKTY